MTSFRRMLHYLRPYWILIALAVSFLFLATVVELLIPLQIERIIDDGIATGDMGIVGIVTLEMIGLVLLSMLFSIANVILSVRVSEHSAADIRDATYRRIQQFSFGNLNELRTGELLVRLTSDVNKIKLVVMMSLIMALRTPLMLVGSLIMLVLISQTLALLLLVLLPLMTGIIWWFTVKSGPMYEAVQRRLDRLNTVMQENLAGVQVVKAFVRADYENERYDRANTQLMNKSIQVNQLVVLLLPTMVLILNLGIAAIIWFGGLQAINGQMTSGEIVAFVNYLLMTMITVMMLGRILPMISAAEASAGRILEVVDSKVKVQDKPQARPIDPEQVNGRIAFENVTFDYDSDQNEHEAVLKNIDFVARPGETVAILGATGSGKSTLVNLIPRLYDVSEGRVTIDGVDVREVTKESLRALVGVCLQETLLFSGTIRDNIAFGDHDASQDDIVTAAQLAAADDFITSKHDSYDTVVGKRGAGLSGGQRQRVAIARALARRPKILILDDSTSSVDVATEVRIQKALDDKLEDVTSFIVAQRISTVLTAAKIIVLDKGRIAAIGNHRELMTSSPIYQEIYESQLGDGPLNGNGRPQDGI
ncbi:MAG: ABC transporter ATP-binding protein/permease [Anaerolineales bacterium]|nr:ABC transporter ATP-binding protein/permease [Anaerolineales bacterium]